MKKLVIWALVLTLLVTQVPVQAATSYYGSVKASLSVKKGTYKKEFKVKIKANAKLKKVLASKKASLYYTINGGAYKKTKLTSSLSIKKGTTKLNVYLAQSKKSKLVKKQLLVQTKYQVKPPKKTDSNAGKEDSPNTDQGQDTSSDGKVALTEEQMKAAEEAQKAQQNKEILETRSNAIISEIIKTGMTEFEKAKAIHDWLVLNVQYDFDNYINNTKPNESYLAEGALIKGICVCAGYADAFRMLAQKAGLECKYIGGSVSGGAHAWNLVKVYGNWYHVDCTWDDPVPDVKGYVSYAYFLKSDSQMADHKWNAADFPACSATPDFGKEFFKGYTIVTTKEEMQALLAANCYDGSHTLNVATQNSSQLLNMANSYFLNNDNWYCKSFASTYSSSYGGYTITKINYELERAYPENQDPQLVNLVQTTEEAKNKIVAQYQSGQTILITYKSGRVLIGDAMKDAAKTLGYIWDMSKFDMKKDTIKRKAGAYEKVTIADPGFKKAPVVSYQNPVATPEQLQAYLYQIATAGGTGIVTPQWKTSASQIETYLKTALAAKEYLLVGVQIDTLDYPTEGLTQYTLSKIQIKKIETGTGSIIPPQPDQPQKPEQPQQPEQPQKPDQPQQPEQPQKPEQPTIPTGSAVQI